MLKRNPKVRTVVHTSPKKVKPNLSGVQRLREGCLIIGVLCAVLMAVSLISFNPADPSWSQTAWGGDVSNAGGLVGAWVGDTLLFTFGVLAYFVPAIIVLLSWIVFRKRTESEPIDLMLWATRLLGGALLIVTSCGLADLNFDDIWYFSSGGVVGDVITSLALPTLNALGTTLAFLFIWGASFTLFTGISWLSIVESIGQRTLKFVGGGLNFVRGDKAQLIEPTRLDDQKLVYADTTPDVLLDEAPLSDDPSRATEAGETSAEDGQYKIYMPEGSEEDEFTFDRGNNLHAPIEQLERDAQLVNDYVEPTDTSEVVAPVHTDADHSAPVATTEQATQSKASHSNEPATVASSNGQPPIFSSASSASSAASAASVAPSEEHPSERESHQQTHNVAAQTHHEDTPAQESLDVPDHSAHMHDAHIDDVSAFDIDDDDKHMPNITSHTFDDVDEAQAMDVVEEIDVNDMPVNQAEVNEPASYEPTSKDADVTQTEAHAADDVNLAAMDDINDQYLDHSSAEVASEGAPTVVVAQAPVEEVFEEDVEVEEVEQPLTDAEALAKQVADARARESAAQNPFLMRKDEDLPVPTSPMPTLELLYHPEKRENTIDREALQNIARLVETKLADYKIKATVMGIFPGPVITRFELDLAPGVKVSRISSLSMDLARSLSALAVRVVEVIPGKPYVGLELPNMTRQTVFLSDVISSPQFLENTSPTAVVLGQDIAGDAVVADLAKMPHVLVAGTTGSGKSVGVNVMILSILYKSTPEDVRFIMIDPKMLELSIYEGIPHLLSEVVTDMKDASNALRWCVGEMERRYKLMSALGVRNLKGFNEKLKMAAEAGHPIYDPLWQPGDSMDQEAPLLEKLPFIVVVVDEFADLIMVVGKKVEELIARIAQKARAAGIHLVLATQRPSVDVITGLIKANIPTRVAFTVSTKTDSRTILDQGGAESLLGMGDMLYLPPGSSHTIRVHGAFASDDDVHAVVNDWKARGKPRYIDEITKGEPSPETLLPGEKMEEDTDPLFDQVVEHVTETRRGSVSGVQRRFKIGYNRAARIVEQLEAQGIVSAPGHNGNREVLAPPPIKDI
ncbi:DNA translocase FtsK 4TM domain-containing protein [Vibrio rarus]|uniref:DNA translocase FtsK 4TM domain-containing protein n=1 Tax=Vibrio rarus TaxID=413403 RepID=UPI0021C28D2D|nr:DNA translocase FtsK 4TM domain-containing protein [Vibrio rarus]